jgi:flavin-dependent dehydrogenase
MTTRQKLIEHVLDLAAATLEIPRSDVSAAVNIQELGFNSVSLVGFVEKVSAWLGEDVHPGVFFEHVTLDAFVGYLLEHKAAAVERALAGMPASAPAAKAMDDSNDVWKALEEEACGARPAATMAAAPAAAAAPVLERPVNGPHAGPIPQDLPVILGGGIGGMLISRALIRKNIPHVLIGSAMLSDSPKLGESMTEACTIEFTQEFPGYEKYLFPKEFTPFFMGDIVAGLRFDFFGTMAKLFLDGQAPGVFVHVDRIGFDRALYEEVSRSPLCYWIDDMVSDVDYDQASDKVTAVRLKSGPSIRCTYAWDCTNHVRLLGNKLAIPYTNFDAPRQVIFTHYVEKDCKDLCHREDLPWMHATTLLRADQAHDGLEGVSWFIPLGHYVSVGISIEPKDIGDRNPEQVISDLTRAYQSRGLDYTRHFSRRKEVVSLPSQHFMYERFFGGNWSMVGGCAAGTWFTSGSQISTLVCMASMADKIIQEPQLYGEHYARHVAGFARTQKVYDTLLGSNIGPLDAMKFLSGIVEQARGRISSYYMFRKGLEGRVARTARELWEEQVLVDKQYFEFLRQIATHAAPAQREQQAEAIFAKIKELRAQSGQVKIPYLRSSAARREKAELFI